MVWSLLRLPAVPGASFPATLSEISWCRVWDPCADSLNPQGSSRCRSSHSVATQSMRMLRTRWAPPWGWSCISHDLKCRKGSVPYHTAEIILQGHLWHNNWLSQAAWIFQLSGKFWLRCYMPQGWAMDLTLRLVVMYLIPSMWSVEFSLPYAVPHYPLH